MLDQLHALAALCSPAGATAGGMLLGGMFLAGLAGSVVHCSLMCGPFVLAQIGARLQKIPVAGLCERARLRQAMLLPYHIGRITTYAAIGAAAASLTGLAGAWLLTASFWLLLLGAALFAYQALGRLFPRLRAQSGRDTRLAQWFGPFRRLAARIDVTRPGGALLLGLALGGLPCTFLYSAVAVAASAAGPAGGAMALAAFGLGTVPTLIVVGVAGHGAGRLWNGSVMRAAPWLLLLNAALLGFLALSGLAA